MRLLKLKLKNIASLKGEHLIEFDKLTNESPLFAITGETGSGKSTILNSVAMALYGRVYKTSLTQADIVTLGEREGQIQLIFNIKGQNYLAEWRGRIRKPNGEVLKKPTLDRFIQKLNGSDFIDERSGENLSADDLLNLNFDQFCKCIILNQGEFSKFISSSFTERKAILEKLYPGGDIENVSKFLKRQLDSSEQKLSLLNTQLETLSFNPEAGEILKKEHRALLTQKEKFFVWHKRYSKLKKHFESLEAYHKYFNESLRRREKLETEITETTANLNSSLMNVEKTQNAYEAAQRESEERTPLLQDLLKKEEQSKILKTHSEEQLEKIEKLKSKLSLDQKEKDAILNQRSLLAPKLSETTNSFSLNPDQLLSLRIEAETFIDLFTKLEKLTLGLENFKEKLVETEERGKAQKADIEKLKEQTTIPLQQLADELSRLKKQKQDLQDQLTSRKVQEETRSQILKRISELEKNHVEKNQDLKKTQEALETHSPLIKSLELSLSLYDYQIGLKNCLDHAHKEDLDTCPLCDHQVEKNHWQTKQITFTARDFEKIQQELQDKKSKYSGFEQRKHLLTEEILKINQELTKNKDELGPLEGKLITPIPSSDSLDELITQTQKRLLDREHLERELVKLNQEIQKGREIYLSTRESVLRLENEIHPINEQMNQLCEKLKTLQITPSEDVEKLKADLRLLARLLDERKKMEQLDDQLKFLDQLIREASSEIEQTQTLNKKTLNDLVMTEAELSGHLQGKSALDELKALGEKLKEVMSLRQRALDEHKSFEQKISLSRGNLSSVEQILKDYELKFLELTSEIRTLIDEEAPSLKEEVTHFETKLKKLSITIADPLDITLALKDFVSTTLSEVDERLSSLNQEEGIIKEKLTQWETLQDKIKLIELESRDLKEKYERLKRLSSILGVDELRTFALSLVEENLILQTNEELKNLCEARYEIIHQSRRGITPEFYVLDKFREGETRKVSTLSGGETFMVSLAMALALAELTRGQAEIDTLFIDEGFGTLDQDSLEDVLSMLNQIRNRGLMIGIISHIKTLTSALPVNLRLQKTQDGTSKISIVYN